MSAFQVHPEHIAAIIGSTPAEWFNGSGYYGRGTVEETAAMLAQANADSVNHRYPGSPADPVRVTYEQCQRWRRAPLSPIALVKALHSLDYQCCEVDGWKQTQAARWIDAALSWAVSEVPGYDDAAWAIDSAPR